MKTMKQAHEEACRAEGLTEEEIRLDWAQTQADYNDFLDEVSIDSPEVAPKAAPVMVVAR